MFIEGLLAIACLKTAWFTSCLSATKNRSPKDEWSKNSHSLRNECQLTLNVDMFGILAFGQAFFHEHPRNSLEPEPERFHRFSLTAQFLTRSEVPVTQTNTPTCTRWLTRRVASWALSRSMLSRCVQRRPAPKLQEG